VYKYSSSSENKSVFNWTFLLVTLGKPKLHEVIFSLFQKCPVIVMLSKTFEIVKMVCVQYWPNHPGSEQVKTFACAILKCIFEMRFAWTFCNDHLSCFKRYFVTRVDLIKLFWHKFTYSCCKLNRLIWIQQMLPMFMKQAILIKKCE